MIYNSGDILHSMSTADNDNSKDDIPDICANCGKGEESTNSLKACTACKMVKYCNRECQIAHRSQHKKECKKRAAELHEEALFKEPPPDEDCPICFLRMPSLETGRRYQACCGKVICCGCVYAPVFDDKGNVIDQESCPFCRSPALTSNKEVTEKTEKRVRAGDAEALCMMGCYYSGGTYDFPQDYTKALELWHRAGKLGLAAAYYQIGNAYNSGWSVGMNKKKAQYYYELAAMKGDVDARHNVGCMEASAGNMDRAVKHWMKEE